MAEGVLYIRLYWKSCAIPMFPSLFSLLLTIFEDSTQYTTSHKCQQICCCNCMVERVDQTDWKSCPIPMEFSIVSFAFSPQSLKTQQDTQHDPLNANKSVALGPLSTVFLRILFSGVQLFSGNALMHTRVASKFCANPNRGPIGKNPFFGFSAEGNRCHSSGFLSSI
jgi:hypothetical protein